MNDLGTKIIELYHAGGFVMPPLLLGAALLWYSMCKRLLLLTRGDLGVYKDFHERFDKLKNEKGSRADAALLLSEEEDELNSYKTLIKTVVILAPLLGLLGTVSGMIETFDSLAEMSLFSQSGGIAGGISQALITTQMGLAVAIPGLIMGRLLERKQLNLLVDMESMIENAFNDSENHLQGGHHA